MNRQPDTWIRVVQLRATARRKPDSRWLVPAGFVTSRWLVPDGLVMDTR